MLSIHDMYVQANKIMPHGVDGYHVQNKYVNSYEKSNLPKSELKKGSYLEDYAKVHGYVPGPGVYDHAKNLWPSKAKIRKPRPKHKKTYIDQMIQKQKKEKKPAPGQYKLQKSIKEMDEERKIYSRKKRHFQDRMTYLDGIQYEAAQTPGVGKYNTRQRPKSSIVYQRKGDKPEEWRKKHDQINKKSKKKNTEPDMGTYNPKQVKSYERKITKEGEWSRVKRFGDEKGGSGIGPGKYIEVDDWKKKRPASASRVPYKSIYYN